MPKASRGAYQLKSGKHAGQWLAKVMLEGLTASGHPKERRILRATMKEALEEKSRVEMEIARGRFSPERATLAQWSERWLEEHGGRVKLATIRIYEQTMRLHILPRLGRVTLGKLTVSVVSSALHDIGKHNGPHAHNQTRRILHACLQAAWKRQIIAQNPVGLIDTMREPKKVKALWTPEELGRFLEVARGHRLYALWHLAAASGLRRGELLGLCWVDLKGSRLNVVQQAAPGKKGESARLETPKSRRSTRTVYLDSETLAILDVWRTHQLFEQSTMGAAWTGAGEFGELIFTTPWGQAFNPQSITGTFRLLTRKARVPDGMHLHSMRDLMASALLERGFGAQEVADRMGHDPTILLSTYAHTRDERREAMALPVGARVPTREIN